jgi:hypothetical protein
VPGINDHIARQYFDYQPMNSYTNDNGGHGEECARAPSTWEVTREIEYGFGEFSDDVRRTTLRLFCPECGAVQFHSTDPEHGLALAREFTTAAQIGYGSAPVKLAGLFLWPGPLQPYGEKNGPETYFVTTTDVRPSSPDMVAGVLGWTRNYSRSNGAVKWFAGIGCHKWGGVERGGGDKFTSRTAAAKWIAAELAAAKADG